MSSWVATGLVAPPGFHPNACRVVTSGASLCGGWCEPFDDSQAVLFRVSPAQGVEELVREPGRFLDLDAAPGVVWALLAQSRPEEEGSDYQVLASPDGGESWFDSPPIEVESLSRLLAVSPTEAWLLGPEILLRSVDRGQTWEEVQAPGTRNGLNERLACSAGAVLLLTDGYVLSSRDGGGQWEMLDLQGARACAVDGGGILARQDRKIRFGTVQNGKIAWLGDFEHDAEPVRLVVTDSGARFLALPSDPEQYPGILYFESLDRGGNWDIKLIPGRCLEGAADLRSEGGIMVSPRGDLFALAD